MKPYFKIYGIGETIDNLSTIHSITNRAIQQEINKIGNEMLSDLRNITPIVTGRLQQSAFLENGEGMTDLDTTFINITLGYSAPYASEVELRHGMLSRTLEKWNDQIGNRIMVAGLDALGGLKSGSNRISEQESADDSGSN